MDDQVITAAQLRDRINRQVPYMRARYLSPEGRRELLDSMVELEVMASGARARGYAADPDVVQVVKQIMVKELVKREFDARVKPDAVPDAEVEKYFNDHPQEFNRPEEVRVSQILVRDEAGARKIVARARSIAATDEKAFRDLVTASSEDEESKVRGGDLPFFTRNTAMYPAELVSAAFALKEVGEVSSPVRSERGFHILKLTGKRTGFSRPLAEVKTQIRQQIFNQTRGTKMAEFVAGIRKKVKVEIYEDNLKQMTVDGTVAAGK